MENTNKKIRKETESAGVTETQMNKPTRLRMIVLRHLKNQNKNATAEDMDALEGDIKTFVKSIMHGAEELGLKLNCESFIGDSD